MNQYIGIALLTFAWAGTGCSDNHDPIMDEPQVSDKPITLKVEGWKDMTESRTTLFGKDNFYDDKKEGGNFTLYAHIDGTDNTYIPGTRLWYFDETKEWRFRSGDDLITYYWPNSNALNFFAYMPYKDYSGGKIQYVTIGNYTEANGQTFTCNLPETNGTVSTVNQITTVTENDDVEFIYAYAENLTKESNPVHLTFQHPFALIRFKLATGSYRMTVKEIKLAGVDLKGTFSTQTTQWTSANDNTGYTAHIHKRIPVDVNYNTVFGGPFLMMPQTLTDVTLNLIAERAESEDNASTSIDKTVSLSGSWKPGKIYTYTLLYGDNNEEIYYNVIVEDWIEVDYRNDVDVE